MTNEKAKLFPGGSVLIVGIGATSKVGFIASASANQQINAIEPNAEIDGYFLAYSLSVKVDQMRCLSNASTIGIMNQEKTKEVVLALPPRREQMLINEYLDLEITKTESLDGRSKQSTS